MAQVLLSVAATILVGVAVYSGIQSDSPLPDWRWLHGKNDLALHAHVLCALNLSALAFWRG